MKRQDRLRRDEAIIGTQQVVEAMTVQGHNVIGRESFKPVVKEVEVDDKKLHETTIYVPSKTKRIIVIYMD